ISSLARIVSLSPTSITVASLVNKGDSPVSSCSFFSRKNSSIGRRTFILTPCHSNPTTLPHLFLAVRSRRAGRSTASSARPARTRGLRQPRRAALGSEEGPPGQAPADLLVDAAAGALLSRQDDVPAALPSMW